ncbi:carboxymuconolactone decarboxylase family protein [Paraburkholderia sp. MM5482-R1]|uniref:carboxymuconolactone decarboxylase family protein n=1 Tax=unclassified Paraburkholderia TaxID=2615204 RepID=UPI003D24D84D
MSRLQIPATIADAPAASQPFLEAVNKKLGVVPNLFRLIANSPAALEGYLGLAGALAKGALPAQTGERIALAVAEINGCDYCMSAHSYLGKNVAKLDDAEMSANRNGGSNEPKAAPAVQFAAKVAHERGRVSDEDLRVLKEAGYTDAQIVEIVVHIALSVLTNYANVVANTEIDFTVVRTYQGLNNGTRTLLDT